MAANGKKIEQNENIEKIPTPLEAIENEIKVVTFEIQNAQDKHRARVTELVVSDPVCARISGALEAFNERLKTLHSLKGIIIGNTPVESGSEKEKEEETSDKVKETKKKAKK